MSGAYEKLLRTAHAGLNIFLASTVQYIKIEPGVLHNPDQCNRQDADAESDLSPAGLECDKFCPDMSYKSDTEVLDEAKSASGRRQIRYEGAGEVIGDGHGFEHEHHNLCEDQWLRFNCAQGFKLGSWFIKGKVSKSGINEYFSSGLGNAA